MELKELITRSKNFDANLGVRVWYTKTEISVNHTECIKAWATGRKNWLGQYQVIYNDRKDKLFTFEYVFSSALSMRD